MQRLTILPTLMLAAALAVPAQAQLPFGSPRPDPGNLPQCTKAYVQSVEQQVASLEKVRAAGPELVGQVCALIEAGSALVGDELSGSTRARIKGLIGVDVDLRFIKTQCRVSQGNLDREVMTEIGYLKSELRRCGDTI